MDLVYFNLFEGIIFISYLISNLLKNLKSYSFYEMFTSSEWISKSGILFAFLIFWPNILIQKLITKNIDLYYSYLYISNSIGYITLFIFLSLSFYAARKSRVN